MGGRHTCGSRWKLYPVEVYPGTTVCGRHRSISQKKALAWGRGDDGIDIERASATWSTSSFTSYHGQLLSLAVQWGVAIEIERAIKKSARFC